ncbi:unnamed protein product [Hyaloperonospora brassicae]|uniref:Uncharacterized protein n=1 Tax=Hyaloperonospora brassicae TaxID=162125 RepID=A0AAV0TSC3_HYABA|nr:unnamed protein product [Hyaloperonospora brassicae]
MPTAPSVASGASVGHSETRTCGASFPLAQMAFPFSGEWTPRKTPSTSSGASAPMPTAQRPHSHSHYSTSNNRTNDVATGPMAALIGPRPTTAAEPTDSRNVARRLRRQVPHQPIAQLEHHYHQRQQQQQQRPRLGTTATAIACGPSAASLSSSSSAAAAVALRTLRELSTSTVTCGALETSAVQSHRSVRAGTDSRSGSRERHEPTARACADSAKRTPYEQWRRLKRARTASGNSCASTSSSSSFASYVVNPQTGRHDFGLSSGDDDDVDSVTSGVDEATDGHEAQEERPLSSSVLQQIVAPSLPPPPYPVDPYHFYCKATGTTTGARTATAHVTSLLAALFTDCGIEAIFHPLKCKFKCLKYVHYSHVEFVARVYAHARTLLVEFQRRSGSVLLWDGLYRILHQKLVVIVDPAALPCPQSSGQKRVARNSVSSALRDRAVGPPHRDRASTLTPSQSVDHGTRIWRALSLKKPTPSSGVEAMKIMLTSRCLDAMREGCAGLAELTEDVQNSCLVAHAELVVPLIQAVEATDLGMSRCAIGALANIACAVPRFPETELVLAQRTAQQLRMQAIPVVLAQVEHANKQSLFSIELLRECARALGAFARLVSEVESAALAASSVHDERCVRVLRLYAKHRDAQLASHCRAALEQLYRNVSSLRCSIANK